MEVGRADWALNDNADDRTDTVLIGYTLVRVGLGDKTEVQIGSALTRRCAGSLAGRRSWDRLPRPFRGSGIYPLGKRFELEIKDRIIALSAGLELEAVFGRTGWLAAATRQLCQRLLAGAPAGERLFAIGAAPGGIAVEGSVGAYPVRTGHIMRAGGWLGYGPTLAIDRRTLG
jgi:hypothetical protein